MGKTSDLKEKGNLDKPSVRECFHDTGLKLSHCES